MTGTTTGVVGVDKDALGAGMGVDCGLGPIGEGGVRRKFEKESGTKRGLSVLKTDGGDAIGVVGVESEDIQQLPVFDAARDYGLYVRHTLEAPVFPNGAEVLTGEYMTYEDIAFQLSQATGKQIVARQMTLEQFENEMAASGVPRQQMHIMADGYNSISEFGYYGGKASPSVGGLATISFMEFAKTADWSKVLA
ncbi:hypothetical protein K438DRAFT_1999070 [Mycena galopus ATCC 62051]|nr:hypothetical protein K438DRAFT_1999070 [Mycena galopus ATCC 62051]